MSTLLVPTDKLNLIILCSRDGHKLNDYHNHTIQRVPDPRAPVNQNSRAAPDDSR